MNELTTTTDLQKITTGLQAFEEKKQSLAELVESAKAIKIKGLDDKAAYKLVRAKRIELRDAEIQIEKDGKAMRDLITPISKMVSSKEKELLEITKSEKERLIAEEKWFDDENEKIRAEKEAQEKSRIQLRIDQLAQYNVAIDYVMCLGMTDEQFNEKLSVAKTEFEVEQQRLKDEELRIAAEKKAEEDRLQKQKEEQEAERLRLKGIEDKQREEREALDKEKQIIADEKRRIADEAQAVIDAKKREDELSQARKEATDKALKDAENKRLKGLQEKAEQDRILKEKEEKRLARMPDKKRLEEWLHLILTDLELPELKTDEGRAIVTEIMKRVGSLQSYVSQSIDSL